MKKKRSSKQRTTRPFKKSRRRGETDKPGHRTLMTDGVLEFLARADDSVGLGEIIIGMKLPRHERKHVKDILLSLEKKGKVQRRSNKFLLTGDSGLVKAVLDLTARGFGFAMIDGVKAKGKDPFISPANLGGASHGDTILVRLITTSRGKGRTEARVVKIIERGISRLCGIYTASKKKGYVTPDNERLPYTVFIPQSDNLGAANDMAVVVEITDYGTGGRPPQGKIIEVLGDPMTTQVQIRMAIEQFELPLAFPAAILQEAEKLEALTKCEEGRKDLRKVELPRILTMPLQSKRPGTVSDSMFPLPMSAIMSRPAPRSTWKRIAAVPVSTSRTLFYPCCRSGCPTTCAAWFRNRTGLLLPPSSNSMPRVKGPASNSVKV
jgi:ribonuclease R